MNKWQTPGQVDQREVPGEIRLSRQKSALIGGENDYNMPFGRSTFN